MNETNEIIEILEIIKQYRELYSNITDSMYDKEIIFEKGYHKLLAGLSFTLSNFIIQTDNRKDYFDLCKVLMKFSERIKNHRFTKMQLDTFRNIDELRLHDERILDYYKEIDDWLTKEFGNISELRKRTNDLEELWRTDPLPQNWKEYHIEIGDEVNDPILFNEYLVDLLSKIGQAYETFLLFSLFLLIIFRKLDNKKCKKEIKQFRIGTKLKYYQIYENKKKKCQDLPLLKDYLKKAIDNQKFIEIFDWVFGKKGVREIRNLGIHHLNEPGKCDIQDQYIFFYFNKKNPSKYTYNELANVFRQLQFLIFLVEFPNYSMFFHLLYEALRLSIDDKKKRVNN